MLSLVLPIYRSELNIPALLKAVRELDQQTRIEAVFVVDGSPDRSAELLEKELPGFPVRSQLIQLSRNFGSFSAIRAGLAHGTGEYFAMLAADLQEPPDLILQFVKVLESGHADIVIGQRTTRDDPWWSRFLSNLFWGLFRRFAVADIPPGGVDTFGCTRAFRDQLLALPEVDSSLVSLLFWLGFRRQIIPFSRRARQAGKSSWSLRKKIDYALFSIFNFTDLPIRLLMVAGACSAALAVLFGMAVVAFKISGHIQVPGYAALALLITFFGGTATLALGIIGQYVWLSLQNARQRPNYVVRTVVIHDGCLTRVDDASRSR